MQAHKSRHTFLLTIPALTILACDPADSAALPSDEIVALGTTGATTKGSGELEADEDPVLTPEEEAAEAAADEARLDVPDGVFFDPATSMVVGKPPGPGPGPGTGPDKDLLVALVGDMGTGGGPKGVYKLIKDEKADFAIITGDFDYKNDPATFLSEMNAGLGADYPAFPVIGNHDKSKWTQYQADFKARLAKIPGAVCTGDLGVDASCTYRGLHFVLSGVGTIGSKPKHEDYIASALAADNSPWSLCVWHKNMRDLQAGDKPDEAGWQAFKNCQDAGAIVVMGHEHSYARTRTLTDIGNSAKGHGAIGMPELLEVGPGKTFSVVSGLGGKSIRAWDSGIHKSDTWWGTLYTSNYYRKNGVDMKKTPCEHGALFLRFNVDGDPSAAQGYFKSVDGEVIDEFDVVHK
jgi:hypothetical protein